MLAKGSVQVPLLSKGGHKNPEHKTQEMKETLKQIFSDKSLRPHTDRVTQYKPESCVIRENKPYLAFLG